MDNDMNIRTKPGSIIVFTGQGGYEGDNKETNKILTVGKEYEVKEMRVHSWSTEVFIVGYDRSFNSVMFKNIEIYEKGN